MNGCHLTESNVAGYLQSLRMMERTGATIQKYVHGVRSFMEWLDGRPVTKELTAQWKHDLMEKGLSPSTINGRIAAVNGLFHFLGWTEYRVRALKIQRQAFRDNTKELTAEEYFRLAQTARLQSRERLALVMETICSTGIRVSEVRYITVEAARRARATVSLKGKIRTILLPEKLCGKLLQYARRRGIISGEIFLTEGGKSLSRFEIWREMKAVCEKAGVQGSKVFPHNLRHLFAMTYYRANKNIVRLADLLGHSSINTTRIYLISTGEEHARELARMRLIC